MSRPRPLLAEGGSAARAWARLTASGAALIAMTSLGLLVLIAALAPFLSQDRPLVIETDEGTSWPLFAAMSRGDILWLAALTALLGAYLVRRLGAPWRLALPVLLILPLIGIGLALEHEPRHETRRYRAEESGRGAVAAFDLRLRSLLAAGDDEPLRSEIAALSRERRGSLVVLEALMRRADLLDEADPDRRRAAFETLRERNLIELERLRDAVYPINRFAPDQPDFEGLVGPEGGGHLLGSDREGRDLLARLVHGTRLAMTVAVGAGALIALLGLAVGLLAGWFGGAVDWLLERLCEVVLCLPVLFVLVAFAAYLPLAWRTSSLTTAIFIGLILWPNAARLVRAEVMRTKSADFIRAAEAMGLSRRRIFVRHLVPNVLGSVLVAASLAAGQVILIEATLSFLGLGVQGAPSWGRILAESREAALLDSAWHLALFPGLLVFGVVLCFNILGDRLRDALDPRS